jgi:tetratricopeptide (TPR) repeat protein
VTQHAVPRQRWHLARALCALLLAGGVSAPCAAAPRNTPAGADALDLAFRFAAAIEDSEHDEGGAQRAVLRAMVEAGRLDEALALSPEVAGWHRGVAYADLSADLARAGRREEAREYVRRAEEVRGSVGGWQGPRITVQIGKALAALGEGGRAEELLDAAAEGDPGEYAGQAAATLAAARMARGEFDAAMAALARPSEEDFHNAWWRTRGYLDLAGNPTLSRTQRLAALEAARRTVEATVGMRKLDLLKGIAEVNHDLGRQKEARDTLAMVDGWVLDSAAKRPTGAAAIAGLARTWHAIGGTERARDLLVEAETAVRRGALIEQPTLYARVASTYRLIGDGVKARTLYERALDVTEAIGGARPRALAAVAICLSLAQDQAPPDAGLRSRLEGLYGGLSEPVAGAPGAAPANRAGQDLPDGP